MQTITRILIASAFFTLLVGGIVMPLRSHIVRYEGRYHWATKDRMGWDHTYLNLDAEPLKWRVVAQSERLRMHFLKLYGERTRKQIEMHTSLLFGRLKRAGSELVEKTKTKLQQEGHAQIKKLHKKAAARLDALHNKGKELLR